MSTTLRSIDAGVAIGEIFLEKYRVDAILGHGGMGVVASCTHLALNERVAIKMLRRDVLDDADAVERFMREAQAASKLKSEYVARVTDVGRSPTDVPYMVMEYLEGHDLGALLEDRGSIGIPWAVELALQACEALAEAHSIGIVHRDIKPTNLFVTWRPDGSALVKVLDFGISKVMTASSLQLTQTQSLLGTPAYMSPEQMRSARQVDGRTDIWSLGTVLYELLEGRRPFEAESFSEMCIKVAVEPPGTMSKTPPALQQVVLRCLAKTPEHRYGSMADLGADLIPFAQDTHQAQVLVERMTRTLRRSQIHDWEASRVGPGSSILTPRTADRIAAVAVADPAIPVRSPREVAAAAGHASDTVVVPRRRWRGVLLVVAVAAAAAFGVVLSSVREVAPAPDSATTNPSAAPLPIAATPLKPVDDITAASVPAKVPDKVTVIQGEPAAVDAADSGAPAAGARDPRPARTTPSSYPAGSTSESESPAIGTAAAPAGRGASPVSSTGRSDPAARNSRASAAKANAAKANAAKLDAAKAKAASERPCDVFGDPHGTACQKPESSPRRN